MTREMFVRLATVVLAQHNVPKAGDLAEAIARQMDLFSVVMGEEAPHAGKAEPMAEAAFPSPNPSAISTVEPEESDPEPTVDDAEPPIIVPATSLRDVDKYAARTADTATMTPDPVEPRPKRGRPRIKVEELSALIQERTPSRVPVDVDIGGGTMQRVMFVRDVRSRHAHDSVQVVLYPEDSTPTEREVAEVQAVVHVEDMPVNFGALIKSLAQQAAQALRPRGPIVAQAPDPSPGPVTSPNDSYSDPEATKAIHRAFNSMP